MNSDHNHLVALPKEQRINSCMREIFIMRPEVMIAIDSYKRLLTLPRLSDNPGMSIKAKSGQGKSTIGAYMAKHSCAPNSDWPGKIIYIDLARNPANLDLTKLMLMEIGIQFSPAKKPLNRSYRDLAIAEGLIKENNVRGAVIDEAQLLYKGLTDRHREVNFGSVKGFSGFNWGFNICLMGDPDQLEELFRLDDTISSRFNLRLATLPLLTCNPSFIAFAKGFVEMMPLRQESIIDNSFCVKLLKLAARTVVTDIKKELYSPLRSVVAILREASQIAIESGDEYLNSESLDRAFCIMTNKVDTQAYLDRYTRL
ncbi:TniB family NTP-binding protein [Pseudomonas fragi]|uniref:TniB family NTP-binding protein n=1 Tax=Pseudomonas fragi TaxID=296 RepID=UPI0021BEC3DF|nr:TniB family NTP-binding protein [Pseudomonas fragi]UXL36393.1 TniB family NTP-binding protein [Pseudomonas fragi]